MNKKNIMMRKKCLKRRYKLGLDEADDLYYMLGMSFDQFGQIRLALPYFQRALNWMPDDVEAKFQYGLALAQYGVSR